MNTAVFLKKTGFLLVIALLFSMMQEGYPLEEVQLKDLNNETPVIKIVISRKQRLLTLFENDTKIKEYPVGVGRTNFPTPAGQFKIIRMIKNPIWENPYKAAGAMRIAAGPKNPLGTRWMGFKRNTKGEYGIHGTPRPSSVGRASSHGCVRMKIADAEDLFNHVQMGTPVEVH